MLSDSVVAVTANFIHQLLSYNHTDNYFVDIVRIDVIQPPTEEEPAPVQSPVKRKATANVDEEHTGKKHKDRTEEV